MKKYLDKITSIEDKDFHISRVKESLIIRQKGVLVAHINECPFRNKQGELEMAYNLFSVWKDIYQENKTPIYLTFEDVWKKWSEIIPPMAPIID